MTMHTLTRHRDIQNWVTDQKGLPAIRRVPDKFGTVRQRLALSFSRREPAPVTTPSQDDGITPVSWTAWLAELDRQRLALRVSSLDNDFEFVDRKDLN
jgi:hypothetical protein